MLRNRRGGTSLRWLRALLDHGITVHGQVVVCPGVNDAAVLDDTLAGVLDRYPELATLCVVPLGLSRYNREPGLRPHTVGEAAAVIDAVEDWQGVFRAALGRRLVFAADEYYLLAGRPFPLADVYEGFPMHEDGIGMARTFELEFTGQRRAGDRGPERVLRLGRRRAGRGLPRPAETRRPGPGFGSPRRPMALRARRAPRWPSCRRGGRRSACSLDATAARCCAPSLPRSGATTSASSRSPTSSSAGTRA